MALTVKELADKNGVNPRDVVGILIGWGQFATINQELPDDIIDKLESELKEEIKSRAEQRTSFQRVYERYIKKPRPHKCPRCGYPDGIRRRATSLPRSTHKED